MSSHVKSTAILRRPAVVLPLQEKRAGATTRILQLAVILALIPVGTSYLYPRVFNLVATPYRLDQAVVYANRYNPALDKIVDEEQVTLQEFTALDQINAAIVRVRATDAQVADELTTLIGQVRGDLQATLNAAGANVKNLVDALHALDARLRALNGPVDGAGDTVARDRAELGGILHDARSIAAQVHTARGEADNSSRNVSGH